MKHFVEAAELYNKAGQPEKAASLYIKLKKWREASELMDNITTPKLLIQLAKAKETEGNYREAESAYERAKDYENVIRVNLTHMDNPEKAKIIIRDKCPTQAACVMMADYLERKGTRNEAIEFLVMAGKREEAFVLAQSYDLMEAYAEILLKVDEKIPEEHMRIAQFFEGRSKYGMAARHYEHANQARRALDLFLQSGETWYPDAVKMIGRVK